MAAVQEDVKERQAKDANMQGEAASSFEKYDGENVPTAHREGAGLTSTSEHPLYLGDGTPIPIGLTKSGFKKQRRREAWESGKDERKSAAREKKREKAQARRQHNRELPEDEKLARRQRMAADIQRRKTQRKPFPANIVLDSGFDELMTEKVSRGCDQGCPDSVVSSSPLQHSRFHRRLLQ